MLVCDRGSVSEGVLWLASVTSVEFARSTYPERGVSDPGNHVLRQDGTDVIADYGKVMPTLLRRSASAFDAHL